MVDVGYKDRPHVELFILIALQTAARKHGRKLQTYVILLAFIVPIVALGLDILVGNTISLALSVLSVASGAVGIVIERWLFFARPSMW